MRIMTTPTVHKFITLFLISCLAIVILNYGYSFDDKFHFQRISRAVPNSFRNVPVIPSEVAFIPMLFNSFINPLKSRFFDNSTSFNQPKIPLQSDWQPVTGSKYKFAVYSAYAIDKHEVLIIATTKTFSEESVLCQFYFGNESKSEFTRGKIETMEEHWRTKYAGVFIHCLLPESLDTPHSVSVIMSGKTEQRPGNVLSIKDTSRGGNLAKPEFTFSICVLPAFNYNEVFHFVEWLEFYKLMGIRQFTFYNVSFGPATSCILKNEETGNEEDLKVKINVFPWLHNPIKKYGEIRSGPCAECSLSAATNDCVYRHRGLTKYMFFLDFDEFFMPRNATNFSQLIESLQKVHKSLDIGYYSIRNAFFGRFRPNEPLREERCSALSDNSFAYQVCLETFLMKKSLRELNIHVHGDRSKYIIKPEAVKQAGNHVVIKMEPGYYAKIVSPSTLISRHYRYVEQGYYRQIPPDTKAVYDRVSPDFATLLATNVAKRLQFFMDKCDFDLETVFKDKGH